MKKRIDIQDKYDIRNCPFHLNYWTRCLIEDHLITVYDNDIFLFNQMFDETSDINEEPFRRCFRYTRDYCRKNKNGIHRMFSFFRAAFYENLRKMDTMKGWRSGMKKRVPTLEQFAKIVRTNKRRLERLYEELGYARYLMYAAQGIDYSKPNVQHSAPQFDKITIDLDRIDRIEKKIAYYESFNVLWDEWQKKMTPRETDVFHKHYMQDKRVVDIAAELGVSDVRIYGLIGQLEAKYATFIEESS